MGALLGLGGLVGAVVSLVFIIIKAIRKQPKKKAVIDLVVCFVLFVVGLAMPSGDKTEAPAATEAPTATEEPTPTEAPLTFVIMDGELGEYGEDVVLNAETEFEENEIAYHIPAGTYLVTNLNSSGGGQVTVYSGGPEYDGEWQYFIADENCASPIVVMAGETKELEIKEGQFVVLPDGTGNIQFVLK